MDNPENVHNDDVKEQIKLKINTLETYSLHLLPPNYLDLKQQLYIMLIDALSHEGQHIMYPRYEFIMTIFKQDTTVITYGGEKLELALLYMILKRLKNKELFMANIDECIECVEDNGKYKYKICCVNGRIARYLASLCFTDDDAILSAPFNDIKEQKQYILHKIYHIFMRLLNNYPQYLAAYNMQAKPPNDYEHVLGKLFNEAISLSGEDVSINFGDII